MKKLAAIALMTLVGSAILYQAYKKGDAKHIFEIKLLPKEVPLPILFDSAEATASFVGKNRIRVNWSKVMLPTQMDSDHFKCIGFFRPVDVTYYLLELDGQLFLEKHEFVEPLIFAMYKLHVGSENAKRPGTLDSTIRLLPDDPKQLLALAHKMKKSR